MLALYIATLLSFAGILISFAYGTYGSICMSASGTFFRKEIYSDEFAFYDPDGQENNMCSFMMLQVHKDFNQKNKAYPTQFLLFDF